MRNKNGYQCFVKKDVPRSETPLPSSGRLTEASEVTAASEQRERKLWGSHLEDPEKGRVGPSLHGPSVGMVFMVSFQILCPIQWCTLLGSLPADLSPVPSLSHHDCDFFFWSWLAEVCHIFLNQNFWLLDFNTSITPPHTLLLYYCQHNTLCIGSASKCSGIEGCAQSVCPMC